MSADVPAKYLNSPETPLFSKGRLLYNHHRARAAAHEAGTVVAVEGYVDVIALAAHAGSRLTTAMAPSQWVVLDELPRSSGGKIAKGGLRDRIRAELESS